MNFFLFSKRKKPSNDSNFTRTRSNKNQRQDGPNFYQKLWTFNWIKIVVAILAFLTFIFLWQQISNKILLIFFTVLPLFIGYGFSYFLEPINRFFCRFFSLRVSRIIVFIVFLIFTLLLVLGFFFIFFVQLNDLYKIFFYKRGPKGFHAFLALVGEGKGDTITNLEFDKISGDKFQLSYSLLSEQAEVANQSQTPILNKVIFEKDQVAGIFILLLKIASSLTFLKSISLALVGWIYNNLTDYAYLTLLLSNIEIILLFAYLFFFTAIISAFALGKGSQFYQVVWKNLTKNYDQEVADKLKVNLKKNLTAWGRGLLIVQLYILIGSGLFIFIAGIIYSSSSSYDESAIVLTLFLAFCNLIPYIGPTIGFIPIITVGLIDVVNNDISNFESWLPLIVAVGGCFLIQVGESALVSPLVYSRQTKIGPVTVIIGLAITGALFGVLAMPLAIPAILIGKVIYQTVYQEQAVSEQTVSTTASQDEG